MDEKALWDLLCATDDRQPAVVDRYGRVPSFASVGRRPFEPVVSDHLQQLGFTATYPGGAPFAVCLSHDIDLLITSPRERAGSMRRGQIPVNPANVAGLLGRRVDPRYGVEHLVRVERDLGVRSSYYFQALHEGEQDFNYRLEEVAAQISMVQDAGHEIGLHGGHRAFNDRATLASERERLTKATGSAPAGYRNHFLRFNVPGTWELLQQQGFAYDTTYGWSDMAGFRNGLCHPFRPTDPHTGRRSNIVEIPLVIMDATFMFNMKLDEHTAWDLCLRLMDRVAACHGVLTILWHNNYMHTTWGEQYRKLVQRAQEAGAWFATGSELTAHWTTSGCMARMETVIDEHLKPRA